MVAMRNTALMMPLLEKHPARDEAITLLAEGFDMLEEDFEKERFSRSRDAPTGRRPRRRRRAI